MSAEKQRNAFLCGFAVAYGVFFLWMIRSGFHAWFSEDDLFNIYTSKTHTFRELVLACVTFWGPLVRPLPEAVLRELYHVFGFHPWPFNVLRVLLCGAAICVLYAFVRQLTRSREAAVISVVLMGFHPALFSLYFDSGMIFDLCAFLFFYSGLALYCHFRFGPRGIAWWQSSIVILLFLAALDSKEIAVTFPVALLLIELIVFRGRGLTWTRALPLCAGFLMACLYSLGRATTFSSIQEYRPHISLSIYFDSYSHYVAQLLFQPDQVVRPFIPFLLTACVVLAFAMRQRVLIWCALFNIVSILPIAFIPPRNAFAFFVPLVGWALLGAVIISSFRAWVANRHAKLRTISQLASLVTVCALIWPPEISVMRDFRGPAVERDALVNRPYYEDLRRILPADLSGKKILATRVPFQLGWVFLFLLRLGWRDFSITADTIPLLESQRLAVHQDQYDFVVDCAGGHCRLLRSKH